MTIANHRVHAWCKVCGRCHNCVAAGVALITRRPPDPTSRITVEGSPS
jgi:hypothetical protein